MRNQEEYQAISKNLQLVVSLVMGCGLGVGDELLSSKQTE
jgi:hypothetical protein